MALDLNVTRAVLAQTHRRSWRLIWEKEIQPRLPNGGQPADGESPEATPTNNPAGRYQEETNPATESKRPQKPEWSEDLGSFFSDGLKAAYGAIKIATSIKQMTPELDSSVQKKVTPAWLERWSKPPKRLQ